VNDFLPTKRRIPPVKLAVDTDAQASQPIHVDPQLLPPTLEDPAPLKPSKKSSVIKKIGTVVGSMIVVFAVATIAGFSWYQQALSPVSANKNAAKISIVIERGSTPAQIADVLAEKKLIRSTFAFKTYTRLSGDINRLQAGLYRLSPSESTQDIVKHLVAGKVDEFTLTFYPGATLTDTVTKNEDKKVDVTTILTRAGYSTKEITAAFSKTYDHPLFAGKPTTANLEGYIYGETYNFSATATVEDILMRTFDEFYAQIKENNLIDEFKKQNLTLYQGIILASIIQREVYAPVGQSEPSLDQRQVSQIFLKRYREGIVLGSDVTYHYAADKKGVARDNTLDDPYNTRIKVGLPPGPIGAPGLSALLAVADPAAGDFVFFLSGDDDKTYFARTNEEHEQNIKSHCVYKCSLP